MKKLIILFLITLFLYGCGVTKAMTPSFYKDSGWEVDTIRK